MFTSPPSENQNIKSWRLQGFNFTHDHDQELAANVVVGLKVLLSSASIDVFSSYFYVALMRWDQRVGEIKGILCSDRLAEKENQNLLSRDFLLWSRKMVILGGLILLTVGASQIVFCIWFMLYRFSGSACYNRVAEMSLCLSKQRKLRRLSRFHLVISSCLCFLIFVIVIAFVVTLNFVF